MNKYKKWTGFENDRLNFTRAFTQAFVVYGTWDGQGQDVVRAGREGCRLFMAGKFNRARAAADLEP